MENQKIPQFYLQWLRDNTEHYQYKTAEAVQLKKDIESCDCAAEDGQKAMEGFYREFVRLSERNPLNGTGEDGTPAAILAESFYYLFYPNDSGIYIPMMIFLTMGGVVNREDGRRLYERMEKSLAEWQTAELSRTKKKKEETGYAVRAVTKVYGRLLNQPRGSRSFWIRQILMFVLLFCTGVLTVPLTYGSAYKELNGLSRTVLWFSVLVCVLYLIRSVQWIQRQKQWQAVLREWDYCVSYAGGQVGEERVSFRNPQELGRILKTEILERPAGQAEAVAKDEQGAPKREPDYSLFDQENRKVMKSCSRIRASHLLMMALTLLCMVLAVPERTPAFVQRTAGLLKKEAADFLDRHGLRDKTVRVYAQETMTDIQPEMQFSLRTVGANEVLLDAPSGSREVVWCQDAGAILYPLSVVWDDTSGSYWYYVADTDRYLGYLPMANCEVYDGGELAPSEIRLLDASGSEAGDRNAAALTDRSVTTGCDIRPGESVELRLGRGSRIRYLYLVNGDVTSEAAFQAAGRATELRLVFDDTQSYRVSVPGSHSCSPFGCFIRIPEIAASKVRVEVTEMASGHETARLSELKICGQRMQ